MKQYTRTVNHKIKNIKEEFHNISEALGVKDSYLSKPSEEVLKINQALDKVLNFLEKKFYSNGELNRTGEPYSLTLEKLYNQIDWIDSLKILVEFDETAGDSYGAISPESVKLVTNTKDNSVKISSALMRLSLPKLLLDFKKTASGTLKHEFFHLYQMTKWKSLSQNNTEIFKKYSTSDYTDFLKKIDSFIHFDKEDEIYYRDDNVSLEEEVSYHIIYLCYLLNPLEYQAYIQGTYEELVKRYHLYQELYKKEEHTIDDVKRITEYPYRILIKKPQYHLKFLEELLNSEEYKDVNLRELKKAIGPLVKRSLGISENANFYFLKIFNKLSVAFKKFRVKADKMKTLFELEMEDVEKTFINENVVILKKVLPNHEIIISSQYLENLNESLFKSWFNFKKKEIEQGRILI